MEIQANKQFYQCVESVGKRFVIHNGGTRSGKTYAILQYLIYKALNTDPKEALNFTIVRKFLPSLKDSGYSDFFEILNSWGYYDETNHNKTDLKYNLNGHTFKFLATGDQPERLRSMKRDILYIIECQELSKEEMRQLNYRTTTQVFMCYNPSMSEHWVYDLEDNRAEDVAVFVSTFKDNNFISDIFSDAKFNNISLYNSCNINFNNSYIDKCIECDRFSIKYNYNLDDNCTKNKIPVMYFIIGIVGVILFIIGAINCINYWRRNKYSSLNTNYNSL